MHRYLSAASLAIASLVLASLLPGGTAVAATPTFTAHDGHIYAPDGSAFVARGVNLQYGDHPAAALPAITAIAAVHANLIRLELRRNTTVDDLRAALDEAVRVKVPVMLMYWESDITCSHDSQTLRRDFDALWLGRWLDVLKDPQYQPYLMLNIANEWGRSNNSYNAYLTTYSGLIKAMRTKGLHAPIVIDAADCGQATESFLDGRGQGLVDADPDRNLIVSVHAYNKPWNAPDRIDRHIAELQATGLPFLIGEFGDRDLLEDGGNRVDHIHLMQAAQAKGIGWLAWSWKGNGKDTHVLDMSEDYATPVLTRRGEDVVNGPDGLKATAKPAF